MDRPAESELQRYLRSQRALTEALAGADSLDEVAPGFLATVAELLRWEAGALWEVTGQEDPLRFVGGWSAPGLDADPLWQLSREIPFHRGEALPGGAWERGEAFFAPSFSRDSAFPRRDTAAALGLHAALALPIPFGPPEEVLAIAEFHTRADPERSPRLAELLEAISEWLAAFVHRRRGEAQALAEEKLRGAALSASPDSVIVMDAQGRIVELNEAAEALFGFSRDEAVGAELAELIVPEQLRARHRAGLRRYLDHGEKTVIDRRVELPALRRDGTLVPVELTVARNDGPGPPVFTGFARDMSERAEAERDRLRLAEVVRGTQDAVLSKDLNGVITSWNPAAERLYGYSAEEAIGQHISFIIPPNHRDEEQDILARVRRGEGLETYETERVRKDGARVDVSLTISPLENPVLGVVGASVVARDITDERRRRHAQEFLVGASRVLDSSLDPVETARSIVATAVPELAEICVLDFVREDGWLGDSVVAGADPEAAARLERIRHESPLDPAGEHPAAQVLREGRPMIWRDLKAPDVVEQVAQSDEHLQLIDDAGYNSAAVVALVARGRTIGAISFLHAQRDLRYDPADLDLLAELGDRAAMALDNARLYHERDQIANNLQRGLRPPRPASVPGLEVSAVFEAAGERVEIGGDVYDVLPSDDGCWVLVADVAGKGSAAAAVSVAVRHAVRGLTREIEEPDEVLGRINELLLEGTTLNDFATALLLRLRSGPDGWQATLAAAGHPPAVHVAGGEATQLGGGAVLGAWAEGALEVHRLTLASGDTLALCTDGWLEVGPASRHRDADAFAELSRTYASLKLGQMTDCLRLDAIARSEGGLRDDMVILALRAIEEPE